LALLPLPSPVLCPLLFLSLLTSPTTTELYTLSLHDALPISAGDLFVTTSYPVIDLESGGSLDGFIAALDALADLIIPVYGQDGRSEEHTSELQSRENLVCRLLLEKKKLQTPVTQNLSIAHTP